jgi:hypothetical protein
MKFKTLIIAIIFLLFGLFSCKPYHKIARVYDGPERDEASIAIVKGIDPPGKYHISNKQEEYTFINRIDSISVLSGRFGARTPKRCDLLPGIHTIEFHHYINDDTFGIFGKCLGRYIVTVDAEAGRTYIINAETNLKTGIVDVFVTDANSGKRVASTVKYRYVLKEKE